MAMRHGLLAALLAFCATGAQAQQWRTFPAAPAAGEPFVVQYDGFGPGQYVLNASSGQVQGSSIVLTADLSGSDFATAGFPYRASAVVTVPQPGAYALSLVRHVNVVTLPAQDLGTVSVVTAQGPSEPAYRNLSGNWFDPSQSGWGVNLVQGDSGKLLAAWLTYSPDAAGSTTPRPNRWLIVPDGRWISPTEFRGIVYDARGTPLTTAFDAARLMAVPVGMVDLRFTAPDQAQFSGQAGLSWPGEAQLQLLPPLADVNATLRRFAF